jgi:hypothetical protein
LGVPINCQYGGTGLLILYRHTIRSTYTVRYYTITQRLPHYPETPL